MKYWRLLEQEYASGYGPALSRHFVGDETRNDRKVFLDVNKKKAVNQKEAEAIVREVKDLNS